MGALDRTSKLNELLALEEKAEGAGGEIPLHPPGWGPLAAGRILSEAGSTEAQGGGGGGEAADRVVGRLVQLHWKGKFEGQRRRALAALSQIGGAAVPRYFLQAAESPNPQIRECAAAALGAFSGTKVRDGLRSLLDDPEASVRAAACLAAGKQEDPSSTTFLVKRLQDESGKVRRFAAEALGLLGDPEATPALLGALEDLGFAVRKRAAETLGKIGDPAVLDNLAGRLRTGTVAEKWNAAEALADWNAPGAVPPLAAALRDASAKVRKRAAYALGNLPFPGAAAALGESLQDESAEVRGRAAYALGLMESPEAVRFLVPALADENESVRKKAADSLAALAAGAPAGGEWEAGRRALRALLRGPDDDLRFRAAFGLAAAGDGGDPNPMDAVREAAGRPEVFYRRRALAVLGRVDGAGEEELGFLLKGLEDTDPAVRRIAAEALGGIQPEPDVEVKSEVLIETALAGTLEDSDARVRAAAFEGWIMRRERKEKGET